MYFTGRKVGVHKASSLSQRSNTNCYMPHGIKKVISIQSNTKMSAEFSWHFGNNIPVQCCAASISFSNKQNKWKLILTFHGPIKFSLKSNLYLTHFNIQNVHTVGSALWTPCTLVSGYQHADFIFKVELGRVIVQPSSMITQNQVQAQPCPDQQE